MPELPRATSCARRARASTSSCSSDALAHDGRRRERAAARRARRRPRPLGRRARRPPPRRRPGPRRAGRLPRQVRDQEHRAGRRRAAPRHRARGRPAARSATTCAPTCAQAFELDAEPSSPTGASARTAHALGYRGHCLTKSRRYSTTFKQLRADREALRARAAARPLARQITARDRRGRARQRRGVFELAGVGHFTALEDWMAAKGRAEAREARRLAREERSMGASTAGGRQEGGSR